MAILLLFLPLLAQIALLNLLSKFLNGLFFRKFGRRLYLLLMWPGVVVHEMSHLIGCWLTRTRVLEVKFFSPRPSVDGGMTLGYVSHVKPRNPLASLIIGSAPFFGGAAFLWLLLRLIFPEVIAGTSFHPAVPGGGGAAIVPFLAGVGRDYLDFLLALGAALLQGGWRLLFICALIPLSAHIAPSRPDLKHTVWGVLTAAALAGLVILAGRYVSSALPGRVSAWLAGPLNALNVLLSYGLACTALSALIFGSLAAVLGTAGKWIERRRAARTRLRQG